MKYRKEGDKWIIVLDLNEEVVSTLNSFFKENNIKGGFIQGIGALKDVDLWVYNFKEKKFDSKQFSEEFELLSFLGNVTETGLHAHVSLGRHDYSVVGGHLASALVAYTMELVLFETSEIKRKLTKTDVFEAKIIVL
ncbi:MAG: PPC domain-containing DNA-binding protein [Candidatus Micrarchaeota archaeon]